MRATSCERNCPKPVPSCTLPSASAFLTVLILMRWLDSDHQHLVIRTIQANVRVERVHEIRTVLGDKRNDGVEPLLQVLLGKDQPRHVAGFPAAPLFPAHRFPPGLPLDLR